MSTAYSKVKAGWIRLPGYPVGLPAPGYLNCPCGAQPATLIDGPDVPCTCGVTYTANGWIVDATDA